MKCTRAAPGYFASLGDVCTTRLGTFETTLPSPRKSSTQEDEEVKSPVGSGARSECLPGQDPVPLNSTKHQKITQKAEKQLCECRENG